MVLSERLCYRFGGFSSYNAGRLTGPNACEMDNEAFLASLKVMVAKDIEADDEQLLDLRR